MKKNFAFMALVAMIFAAPIFTGCDPAEPEPVKVSNVSFVSTPQPLEVAGTFNFQVTVLPENATDKSVTWNSSKPEVATVTDGVVKAEAAGKTIITATANDGSGKKAEFEVTVNAAPEVAITSSLNLSAVNEINYSYILFGNEAGSAPAPVIVTVAATNNIGKLTLTLTTDHEGLNGILAGMTLTEPFELGSLSAAQTGAMQIIGFPSGDAVVGKPSVTLELNQLFGVIAGQIPDGINQFDIKIEAEDVNGLKAEAKTLKLKFVDDTPYVTIVGRDLNIDEPKEILASAKNDTRVVVDIAAVKNIENLFVEISSTSTAFNTVLGLTMSELAKKFDLANPTDKAAGNLRALGLPYGDWVKGKAELAFDISGFVPMLLTDAFLKAGNFDASFKLTVVDAAGHELEKTLTLKLVNDMYVKITGDGIGETPLEIKKSEAGTIPVKVVVEAPQGIDNFKVLITSSSAAFTAGLTGLNLASEFDLANPDEVLAGSLAAIAAMSVELPSGSAVKEMTELEFDITTFIPMIFGVREQAMETGNCTADFRLTVTDTKGTSQTATIKLSLIDDTVAGE